MFVFFSPWEESLVCSLRLKLLDLWFFEVRRFDITKKQNVYCHWNEYIKYGFWDTRICQVACCCSWFFLGGGVGAWWQEMMYFHESLNRTKHPKDEDTKTTPWSVGGVLYCSMFMFLILTEELQDLDTAMNSMGSMQHSWLLSGVMRYDAIPNNAPRANHSKLSISLHCVLFPHYPMAFMYGILFTYIYHRNRAFM